MRDDKPLVAVVTPVHNAQAFLAECIESVLNQTYTHFEYMILDDGSTDASFEIAVSFAKKDKRVRVERNPTFCRSDGEPQSRVLLAPSGGEVLQGLVAGRSPLSRLHPAHGGSC
jgi:cellulose synthase/poly-beta-1,6-N-acetylglucosamine synthase-like glycosyltransferase